MSAPQQLPASLTCPQCPVTVALDGGFPDDGMTEFWNHLGTHTTDRLDRLRLWLAATEAGEDVTT